jgi:hypothetical protein
MPRVRASRPTLFLAVLLLLAASLVYFSPHQGAPLDPSFLSDSPIGQAYPARANKSSWWNVIGSAAEESAVPGLIYANDGLVKGWDAAKVVAEAKGLRKSDREKLRSLRETHPIEELMRRGKAKWDDQLAR